MELYRLGFALVALILFTLVAVAFADDFDDARKKIEQAKPNIDYDTFCAEKQAGEDKIACRIKGVLTVGFLVCKEPEIEGVNCSTIIRKEINNIQTVKNDGNINTVDISPPPIDGVMCGETPSLSCSGFLEQWLASDTGKFKQVRDRISNNTIAELITEVKNVTTEAGLSKTAADLTKIKNYMIVDAQAEKYRQICDLQGFFLVKGGFLVADVPDILQSTTTDGVCWEGEPTTQQVLDALNKMISAFSGKNGNNAVANRSGRDHDVNIKISLIGIHTVLVILVGGI